MTRHILLTALFLLIALRLPALADHPAVVEAELVPDNEVWVGQRVRLKVTVLVPRWFARAPRFSLPEVAGVLLFDPGDPPVNTTRTVDGEAMSGTIHEFTLIPQRAGAFAIPPVRIQFAVAGEAGARPREAEGETPVLTVRAKQPPGTEGLSSLISASAVSATETWEPDATSARVGDSLARTIVFTADDVPGMAFPPIDFGRIEGVSVYRDTPRVEDERERGQFLGRRTERATYVWQREGCFELPTLVFVWWNTKAMRLERVKLPGRRIEVIPGSSVQGQAEKVEPGAGWAGWWLLVPAAVVLAIGGGILLLRGRRAGAERDGEAWCYRELERACRANNAALGYRSLFNWLDAVRPGAEATTLSELGRDVGDPRLVADLGDLEHAAVLGSGEWSGRRLGSALPALRRRYGRAGAGSRQGALPPLNPDC